MWITWFTYHVEQIRRSCSVEKQDHYFNLISSLIAYCYSWTPNTVVLASLFARNFQPAKRTKIIPYMYKAYFKVDSKTVTFPRHITLHFIEFHYLRCPMCQNESKWSPKIKQYLYFVSLLLIGFILANRNAVLYCKGGAWSGFWISGLECQEKSLESIKINSIFFWRQNNCISHQFVYMNVFFINRVDKVIWPPESWRKFNLIKMSLPFWESYFSSFLRIVECVRSAMYL